MCSSNRAGIGNCAVSKSPTVRLQTCSPAAIILRMFAAILRISEPTNPRTLSDNDRSTREGSPNCSVDRVSCDMQVIVSGPAALDQPTFKPSIFCWLE